jgi:hypothetical protein
MTLPCEVSMQLIHTAHSQATGIVIRAWNPTQASTAAGTPTTRQRITVHSGGIWSNSFMNDSGRKSAAGCSGRER